MAIGLREVSYRYHNGYSAPVLQDFTVSFREGSFTAILGPSGCGKTTLLLTIAGLLPPHGGELIGGPARMSMLFQEPRLVPWLRIEQNIALVLESIFSDPKERHAVATDALARVGLSGRGHAYPGELSGGERQRVGMARAYAYPAGLLLMDEPFQSLDVVTRLKLLETFRALWQSRGPTVVAVTHSPWEAAAMADRCLVVTGAPLEIVADLDLADATGQGGRSAERIAAQEARIIAAIPGVS
jgi:NitT/TauT family transport system ATP-binding protein